MKFHFVAADLGTSRFMAEFWERDDFFFYVKVWERLLRFSES